MRFTTYFFDLDETLYPSSSGLWVQIRSRINSYMHDRMGLDWKVVEVLREKYFREYGTTLRGLQANYSVDMEDYLAYVHDLPLAQFLHPDPALPLALKNIPGRKFIFTNADCAHASRVTKALNLEQIFSGCIDVHAMAPYCKPMPESIQCALENAGGPDPDKCVLLDDQARTTRVARQFGIFTVLVGKNAPGEDADIAIPILADLPKALNIQ